MDNIEKVLDRGEKIEVLVDKTEALRFQADNFHKQGRALRNRCGGIFEDEVDIADFQYRRRDYYFLVCFVSEEELQSAKKKKSSEEWREGWRGGFCSWLPELKARMLMGMWRWRVIEEERFSWKMEIRERTRT